MQFGKILVSLALTFLLSQICVEARPADSESSSQLAQEKNGGEFTLKLDTPFLKLNLSGPNDPGMVIQYCFSISHMYVYYICALLSSIVYTALAL